MRGKHLESSFHHCGGPVNLMQACSSVGKVTDHISDHRGGQWRSQVTDDARALHVFPFFFLFFFFFFLWGGGGGGGGGWGSVVQLILKH